MGPFSYEETFECYSSRFILYFYFFPHVQEWPILSRSNLGDSIEVRGDGCKKGGFDLEDHDDST